VQDHDKAPAIRRARDLAELPGPVVAAARIDADASIMNVYLGAVAVDLDLVKPSGTIGRAITQGWVARLDEPKVGRPRRSPRSGT
jgi:hypothetical protein